LKWKIPLFRIYWDEDCIKAITEVIASGMNWAVGSEVSKFEEAISEYLGTSFSVTLNSGTSALHATLLAHKIREGDEVIVPSFTFIATSNAPLFVGAKPVFADIEERTFGLDPEDVKEKISKKTKAIITVHYGGCPSKAKELREIADDYKVILIEDAAEAFGSRIDDVKVCNFGNSSILSFCQNKVITTGEGGAVITNDKEIYDRLKLIKAHGRLEKQDYFSSTDSGDYIALGYNFRLSNILAALGLAQIKKTDKIIEMRRKNALTMSEKLSKIKDIILPEPPPNYYHVYQLYTIRVTKEVRDNLFNFLAKKGIMVKIYFQPVHLTTFYRSLLGYKEELPVTEELSKEVLTLPMYPTLSENDINYIVRNVKQFYRELI